MTCKVCKQGLLFPLMQMSFNKATLRSSDQSAELLSRLAVWCSVGVKALSMGWRFDLGHQFQVECPSGLWKAFHSCWQCQSKVLWTTLKETHVLRKAHVPLDVFKHANPRASDWDFSVTETLGLWEGKEVKTDKQKNSQPFPVSYSKEYKILTKGQKVAWPTTLSSNF